VLCHLGDTLVGSLIFNILNLVEGLERLVKSFQQNFFSFFYVKLYMYEIIFFHREKIHFGVKDLFSFM